MTALQPKCSTTVRPMITTRRALPVAVALTFVLASCGGSSDGGADEVEAPVTAAETVAEAADDFTEGDGSETDVDSATDADSATDSATDSAADDAPEPTEESAETTPPGETVPADADETGAATTDAAEEEPVPESPAGSAIDVTLSEWSIAAPTEYTAGEITFNASNGGSFPHELVVIEGEGYESLPLAEGGAVIEEELPTGALIGRTDRVGGGSTEALTVTLAPGSYVLVCNLGGSNNSHAGQGQRLDITVS